MDGRTSAGSRPEARKLSQACRMQAMRSVLMAMSSPRAVRAVSCRPGRRGNGSARAGCRRPSGPGGTRRCRSRRCGGRPRALRGVVAVVRTWSRGKRRATPAGSAPWLLTPSVTRMPSRSRARERSSWPRPAVRPRATSVSPSGRTASTSSTTRTSGRGLSTDVTTSVRLQNSTVAKSSSAAATAADAAASAALTNGAPRIEPLTSSIRTTARRPADRSRTQKSS